MMSRKLALITILSLLVTHTTTASASLVDLALQSIGGGSVTEMKSHIGLKKRNDVPEALNRLRMKGLLVLSKERPPKYSLRNSTISSQIL